MRKREDCFDRPFDRAQARLSTNGKPAIQPLNPVTLSMSKGSSGVLQQSQSTHMRRSAMRLRSLLAGIIVWAATGCTSVDMLRLSDQSFSPKASLEEVELLDREPQCPHLRLADLRIDDSTADYQTMQDAILHKAMALGADAVVFAKPEKNIQQQITYQPAYSPWGYSAYNHPGWGYGGWHYGSYGYDWGGTAMPYDMTVRSLRGLAIRYVERGGPRC